MFDLFAAYKIEKNEARRLPVARPNRRVERTALKMDQPARAAGVLFDRFDLFYFREELAHGSGHPAVQGGH